jgi:hypothetical protein
VLELSDQTHSERPTQPALKCDATVDVKAAVQRIEDAADLCYKPLALLRLPANVAIWSLLTCLIVELTEKNQNGPTNHEFTNSISNASRAIATAIDWVLQYGRSPSRVVNPQWTPSTRAAALAALREAHQYETFRSCLPMWHKHLFAVTVVNPTLAVFQMHGDGPRQRQVAAYLKGHRPPTTTGAPWFGLPQTPESLALYDGVLNHATNRKNGSLSYDPPLRLWAYLLPQYLERVNKIVRRSSELQLGGYILGDYCQFYAALSTIAAAHEFLCFRWGQRQQIYPADSAVMVRLRQDWIRVLASLSGLSKEKTTTIVDDLTLDVSPTAHLVVQPFVPLGERSPWLAMAPPLPLSSRMDESILTVLNKSRRSEFDQTTLSKEAELRAHVRAQCPQFSPQGPRSMPKPLPDIDLILTDEVSSTVAFCEAKWLRSVSRASERINRDEDFAKGFQQAADIQAFLVANPRHLMSLRTLPRSLDQYKNTHYIVLARDHWFWREPENNIAVLEFEAFVRIVGGASDLQLAMEELLRYEWLPLEGQHFEVKNQVATAGGVSINSQTFYGLPQQRISIPRN